MRPRVRADDVAAAVHPDEDWELAAAASTCLACGGGYGDAQVETVRGGFAQGGGCGKGVLDELGGLVFETTGS